MINYTPIIKGIAIFLFLEVTMANPGFDNPSWWVALIALTVMANA